MNARKVLFTAAIIGGVLTRSAVWLALFVCIAWVIGAYFWPFGPCWRCRGRKVNPGSSRRRFGLCKQCKGSGSRQVIGSKTVHRMVRGVVKARQNGAK